MALFCSVLGPDHTDYLLRMVKALSGICPYTNSLIFLETTNLSIIYICGASFLLGSLLQAS
jgi:hypothetical protein